jgi:hypothetical protein
MSDNAPMTGHDPHVGPDRPGDKDLHEEPAIELGPHEHRWVGDRCEACGMARDITSPPLPRAQERIEQRES